MDRETALNILNSIEKNGAFSNLAVNEAIKRAEGADAAFVRRLVYGVLENKIYLDYYISRFLKDPVEKVKKNSLNILRLALYQILFMDSVPDYAAVNESVELAKRTGKAQAPFVNGVLRNVLRTKGKVKLPDPSRDMVRYLSIKYSFPKWMIKYISEGYGMEFTQKYLESANDVPPLTIRVNCLKTGVEDLRKILEAEGFEVSPGKNSPRALEIKGTGIFETEAFKEGLFYAQDESSMMAVEALDPKPGETVIDICAAPGGKTLYAGELMENRGRIIACDIYENKLGLVRKTAEKNGLDIVETRCLDGRKPCDEFKGLADRVICDVPCSGLGVVRRKPEIKYTKTAQDIKDMCKIQYAILKNGASYLKSGGTMVYSTCTVSYLENRGVVNHFMTKPESEGLRIEEMRQLTPFENSTDGFFICKIVRE